MKPLEYQRVINDLNHELDQLLYAISHDLSAPLRAIDGFSQAVLEDYGDVLDEQGRDYLKRVRGGSGKISRYIEGLLWISRQSRGEIELERLDFSEISLEAGALVAAEYPEHAPAFKVEKCLGVTMDRRLAKNLMLKLLDNAWKFTTGAENAQVEIGGVEVSGERAIYVRDNGAGFDMEYARERLFGAFQRMHEEDEFPGLGTGLATAMRIINRHGGRIWAESETGKGTTIYFRVGEM